MTSHDPAFVFPTASPGRKLWLFRPGRLVTYETLAFDHGLLVPSFGVRADLRDFFELEEIMREIEEANAGETRRKIESWASQLHLLLHMVQPGDLIVVPNKRKGTIGIAMARPECRLSDEGETGRAVEWIRKDLSRSMFMPDLLHSFEALQHVCAISRNDAMNRILHLVEHGKDPGLGVAGPSAIDVESIDVEELARKRMLAKIGTTFAGHGLAELVCAVLEADGYRCRLSPPGPDGGVDILAGRGVVGLSDPLVVQVKSGDIVADLPTWQQLAGAMSQHGSRAGLLVSWSGVTRPVRAKMADNWFGIRVWDGSDLLAAIAERYDALPLPIRDRLGFRRALII